MRDLVTPFATVLKRLSTDAAGLIPEERIREVYRDTKISRSVRDALVRQLPVDVPRNAVKSIRVPGHVLLANPGQAEPL